MQGIRKAKKAVAERPIRASINSAYIVLYNSWAKGLENLSSNHRNMHSTMDEQWRAKGSLKTSKSLSQQMFGKGNTGIIIISES